MLALSFIVGVVIVLALILAFRGIRLPPPEDEFRKRWGGSDARQIKERSYPCPTCGGHGYDEFGECDRCKGHGYIIGAP